jgi:Mycobacterium membrane protein
MERADGKFCRKAGSTLRALSMVRSCSTHVELDASGERVSIDPLHADNGAFSSWPTDGRLGAVFEAGVRDVAEHLPDVTTADLETVSQPSPAPRTPRNSHRSRRFRIFSVLRRLWIPLVIFTVIGAGGWTVSRLHGVFGSEKRPLYADAASTNTKPFDPKHMTYEVFGPPGTVASISYFDVNAEPRRVEEARVPWSVDFDSTEATAMAGVAAQGNSDSLGCRIVVDGVVKAEKSTHEASAFVSCKLKDE